MTRILKTLPKHTNSFNGAKAHNDSEYVLVGRVEYGSWMIGALDVGDIIISERNLFHIERGKKKALTALGTNAYQWVCDIIKDCCEIRIDERGGIFFIKDSVTFVNEPTGECAIAELHEAWLGEKRVYIITTARPEHWEELLILERLCVNPRP